MDVPSKILLTVAVAGLLFGAVNFILKLWQHRAEEQQKDKRELVQLVWGLQKTIDRVEDRILNRVRQEMFEAGLQKVKPFFTMSSLKDDVVSSLPLPITHQKFEFTARTISAAKADAKLAAQAARDKMILGEEEPILLELIEPGPVDPRTALDPNWITGGEK